jgi:hypothetical protein
LRFPVADAARYAGRLAARGAALFREPSTLEREPFGRFVVFGVRTPDGALLELFSKG